MSPSRLARLVVRLAAPAIALSSAGCPSTADLTNGFVYEGGSSGNGSSTSGNPSPSPTGTGTTTPPVPNRRCNPQSGFGNPTAVGELSGVTQRLKPALCVTQDELEIFYLLNDGGGVGGMPTLRHGRRTQSDAVWTVQTEAAPDPPPADLASLVSNGTKLYYFVTISGVNVMHAATRANRNAPFGQGVRVTINEDATPVGFVVETDDFVYFGDGADIRRAFVAGGAFSYNGELALTGHSQIPVVSSDQRHLYFSEFVATGSLVYGAHRDSTDAEFGTPLFALKAASLANVRWIADDDCVMYLEGEDDTQVYESRRGK